MSKLGLFGPNVLFVALGPKLAEPTRAASSSQPILCAPKRTPEFFAELTESAAELSEFSLLEQHSRNHNMSYSRMYWGGRQCGNAAPLIRNTPSTAGNSMTSSERPSPEPLLKKEASPAILGGERILEMLWSRIIGFGGSQPYSRGEFQETL